MAIFYLIIK
jgi:fumarate hydratase class II